MPPPEAPAAPVLHRGAAAASRRANRAAPRGRPVPPAGDLRHLPGRRPAGFTLLEMAAVLAIAAVLAAVATPSFSGLVARERLNAAAHLLQADIALARHEAGRRGAVVHLHFQTGAQWCYAISTAPAVDCRQPTLVPGGSVIKVVRAPEPPGVTLLAATAMAIDSRSGTSLLAEGQARFASPQSGQQLQVSLGRLGRASICAPAGPVAGAPPCTPPLAS